MRTAFAAALFASVASAHEGIWIEAEHLDGIRGYCWPLGKPEMRKTAGHWAISGPGWAAEWNQGGESGFLSIATGADDDKASATTTVEIPVAGKWFVWVRYGDWREKTERFEVRLDQAGRPGFVGKFGERAMIDEDNEMKLYFGWAFAWDGRAVDLAKGPATLTLATTVRDAEPRQIDCLVLTTDPNYRPLIKERPRDAARALLDAYRKGIPDSVTPLTRNAPSVELPASWKTKSFRDKGFLYLWNMNPAKPYNWLSDDPNRVLFPYLVNDEDARKDFEKVYAGRKDVPIFSDPRVVPTFHGAGPAIFTADAKTGEVNDAGKRFAKWLDDNPQRQWAMMMNYSADKPVGDKATEQFLKYRDRFVGSIAGESLGYFYPDAKSIAEATKDVKTRRQLAEAISRLCLEGNAAKYRKVFGKDLDANHYQDVISCLSVGNIVYAPLCLDWGARTVGYESAAFTSSLLPMRWAFLRGAARQFGAVGATYRSCNFGDSATMFSVGQSYTSPRNIFDNYYSVYSGAGMTWYKFDIWYQYMAGSSIFYHEQGFDEYWKPGGLTAAGIKEVQLSPKGQLVDRFLRLTAGDPDRGSPYTPVAFLVDYAHGWEPSPYWPNSFKNFHNNPQTFRFGDHEKMLEQYLWAAYHPIVAESEKPINGVNEVFVPGVFGDMFDVIFAYPDVSKWKTVDTYAAVVCAGDIELTTAEGKRLAAYVEQGGTLVVADAHLTGAGVAELSLPKMGDLVETQGWTWDSNGAALPCGRFRCRAIEGGQALAKSAEGHVFCASFDRGKGRLIVLSVPRGLTMSRTVHPAFVRLLAGVTRGLMPIEVHGEVEWMLNRTSAGWRVTLMNPAGAAKPQQGITPTDYRENRKVTIRSRTQSFRTAVDRLLPDDPLPVTPVPGRGGSVDVTVPAGAVRIIELRN